MKPPPPGAAVAVEVIAILCLTLLAALGRVDPAVVVGLATLAVTGYAVSRGGPGGGGAPGSGAAPTQLSAAAPAPSQLSSGVVRVALAVVAVLLATGVGRWAGTLTRA